MPEELSIKANGLKFRALKDGEQFRLAAKNDLKKLFLVGVGVAQQANFFEELDAPLGGAPTETRRRQWPQMRDGHLGVSIGKCAQTLSELSEKAM